jgi:hypothetical protein
MIQYNCSKELIAGKSKRRMKEKGIEFEELLPGKSYVLPITECNISSLQVQCSKYSKLLKRTFRLHYHASLGLVEVGRVDSMNDHTSTINTL